MVVLGLAGFLLDLLARLFRADANSTLRMKTELIMIVENDNSSYHWHNNDDNSSNHF